MEDAVIGVGRRNAKMGEKLMPDIPVQRVVSRKISKIIANHQRSLPILIEKFLQLPPNVPYCSVTLEDHRGGGPQNLDSGVSSESDS